MNDDLNFKSWRIEEPSSEKMNELFNKAKSRVAQRRRRRRIGTGIVAVLIASTAVLYGLFGRSTFENELAETHKLIEKEINDSRDMVYCAENEKGTVSYMREDYHDFHF